MKSEKQAIKKIGNQKKIGSQKKKEIGKSRKLERVGNQKMQDI